MIETRRQVLARIARQFIPVMNDRGAITMLANRLGQTSDDDVKRLCRRFLDGGPAAVRPLVEEYRLAADAEVVTEFVPADEFDDLNPDGTLRRRMVTSDEDPPRSFTSRPDLPTNPLSNRPFTPPPVPSTPATIAAHLATAPRPAATTPTPSMVHPQHAPSSHPASSMQIPPAVDERFPDRQDVDEFNEGR